MSTTPYEIIAGPANIWVAVVGTSFPNTDASPAAAWVSLGTTEGGVTVTHEQSVELIRVDQATGPKKAIRSEEGMVVAFSLAELTLENYGRALNAVTPTVAAGPPAVKYITLRQGFDVTQRAVLVRGPSPYGDLNMQFEIPVAVQVAAPSPAFVNDDKAVLDMEWTALEDPNAGSDAARFGHLRAQTT